ncbi:hypothetical protein EON82_07650 [bacterium]|nr:MAG: hypothetical protein EON82_07650 [bacterium]
MRRCSIKGIDGGPSGLWIEAKRESPGEADLFLGHAKGGRFIAHVSHAQLHSAWLSRRGIPAGEVEIFFEADRNDYRLDYQPSRGPDHGLRLWVGRDDLELLVGRE